MFAHNTLDEEVYHDNIDRRAIDTEATTALMLAVQNGNVFTYSKHF